VANTLGVRGCPSPGGGRCCYPFARYSRVARRAARRRRRTRASAMRSPSRDTVRLGAARSSGQGRSESRPGDLHGHLYGHFGAIARHCPPRACRRAPENRAGMRRATRCDRGRTSADLAGARCAYPDGGTWQYHRCVREAVMLCVATVLLTTVLTIAPVDFRGSRWRSGGPFAAWLLQPGSLWESVDRGYFNDRLTRGTTPGCIGR